MGKSLFSPKSTVIMMLILGTSLIGCSSIQVSNRDFSAEDLLLAQDWVPLTWERTQVVPVSVTSFGFGNEEFDRHVGFVRQDDPQDRVFANHFVLVFRNNRKAASWYKDKLPSWFNDNSIAVNEPWGSHPDLTYEPSSALQHRIACTEGNIAGEQFVCLFMAQYEEFVVIFSTVIAADTTSVSGFNKLVEQIDKLMTNHLQEG